MHYQTCYEERHQPIDAVGEAEMINSIKPKHCPYCEFELFIRYGHNKNGINRYKCVCRRVFQAYHRNGIRLMENGRLCMDRILSEYLPIRVV